MISKHIVWMCLSILASTWFVNPPFAIAQTNGEPKEPASVFEYGQGLDDKVNAILLQGDTLYVGGSFLRADSVTVNHIARWINGGWQPMQSGLNGSVQAFARDDAFLYVGGEFTLAGNQTARHIVRWDGASWQSMGVGVNGTVRAIQVHKGKVYIAGDFTSAGGSELNHISVWSGTQWDPLGSGLNGDVYGLYSMGDDLVVGGSFTAAGGLPANNIARWNGTEWSPLGSGLNGVVHAVSSYRGQLLAGGAIPGGVATWNGTAWNSVGSAITGIVYSVSVEGDDLILGGDFVSTLDSSIRNLAHIEGESTKNPGVADSTVHASAIRNGIIYVGGSFSTLSGVDQAYFGRLALDLPAAPSLLSPQNNTAEITTNPLFQWQRILNAFSFRIQVGTSSDFTSIEHDRVITEDNMLELPLDKGLTTYFYRVLATNNRGNSDWSETRTFRTRLSYPRASKPGDAQNGINSKVTFEWDAVPQAQSYVLQVSNSPSYEGTLIANESGLSQTSFTLEGLSDNITYFWRLKAERVGSESDWSPSRQFTVNLPPATPLLLLPEDGIVNYDTLSVVFRWGAIRNATHFQFQVSRSAQFTEIDFEQTTTTSSVTLAKLLPNTTYYWRVRANNIGGPSAWSMTRSLTTIISPPSQVVTVQPANEETRVTLSPWFRWQKIQQAVNYRIQVSTTQSFATFVLNESTNDTTVQARGLLPNRTYYWRVRSSNAGGDGPWSSTFSFVTVNQNATSPPILSLPGNDAFDLANPVQLDWSATQGATSYRLQLSLVGDFSRRIIDTTGVQSLRFILPDLPTSERYYWRIAALNAAGESNWSEVRTFRTVVVTPGAPALILPVDRLENVKTPLLLTWNRVQGATSYSLEVSDDPTFGTTTVSIDGQAATQFSLTNLLPQTTYYWRVRARNAAGYGPWSIAWVFTSVIQSPAKVVLIQPGNNNLNTQLPVTLSWNPTIRSEGYRIQLSDIEDLDSSVLIDTTITNTSYKLTFLNKGQKYYWRVASFNVGGQGEWSDLRNFTTIPEPPLAPTLRSPNTGLDFIPQPVIMTWSSNSLVDRYRLQMSLTEDFESQLVIDNTDIKEPMLDLSSVSLLRFNTVHFWRVKAYNNSGESAWSQTWSFRTRPEPPARTRIVVPQDGAQMVLMPLALQWEPAARAQGYDLQLSESNRFDQDLVADLTNYEDVTFIFDNLKPEQTYWARVASRNPSGISDWSETTHFTTAPKVPDPPLLVAPGNNTTNMRRTQTFVWRSRSGANRYQIQISRSADFSSNVYTSAELPDTTLSNYFLDRFDQDYHWRVRASNISGSGIWSEPHTLKTFPYPTTIMVQATIPFANTRQSSYRLAALAGNVNVPIAFTFEELGKQGTDWNAFAETGGNGTSPSNVVEVSRNSSAFNFIPGRGFWVLSKNDWTYSVTPNPSTVPLSNQDSYRISLRRGWNIIANPFHVPVSWSAVKQRNGINEEIHTFERFWDTSTTMRVNMAYYFFNAGNKDSLEIPYPHDTAAFPLTSETLLGEDQLKESTDPNITTHLKLYHSEGILGRVTTQVHKESTNGYDKYDLVAPPGLFATANVYLRSSELIEGVNQWARLSYPLQSTLITATLVLELSQSDDYTFRISELADGMSSYLFDPSSGRKLHFDPQGQIDIYLTKGAHHFDWIVGSDLAVEEHSASQLPEAFRLYDAFPNPFNPTTTVQFALPTDSNVQLTVFDITGRRVATVAQGSFRAGYHQLTWNAARFASGVYLLELRAGAFRATSKVALVK